MLQHSFPKYFSFSNFIYALLHLLYNNVNYNLACYPRTSTKKHDSHGDVDELSWLFSSSQTNNGDSIDALYSGVPVQSSQFDSNTSKDSLANQDSITLKCPNKFESTIADDSSSNLVYRSFAQWMDVDGADMVFSTTKQVDSYLQLCNVWHFLYLWGIFS